MIFHLLIFQYNEMERKNMSNIDEKIKELFSKNIKTKTMIVSLEELEKVKKEYEEKGWKMISSSPINGRYKVTFQIVK